MTLVLARFPRRLFTAAEVVTKDMLDPGHDETTWAALDFMTAEGAGMCRGGGSWKMGREISDPYIDIGYGYNMNNTIICSNI